MTGWKMIAGALDPPIPEEALPKVIPVVETLEEALRPWTEALPLDTLPWRDCPK